MYDSIAIQKLNELIVEHKESVMLQTDSSKAINDYLEMLTKYIEERDWDKKIKLEANILKTFAIKKGEYGSYEPLEAPKDPVMDLIREKTGDSYILKLDRAKKACEKLNDFTFKWKLLIERTQKCLRDEKFKPDLKPIVTLSCDKIRQNNEEVDVFFAVVVIINLYCPTKIGIASGKIKIPGNTEENIQKMESRGYPELNRFKSCGCGGFPRFD